MNYNKKIDIWSLGCILSELFTGEVLFENESVPELLAKVYITISIFKTKLIFNSNLFIKM